MQLSELQTNVNYRRRDTTENFVSNDEIKTYLNEALDTIQAENEWEWARVSTSFSYTSGSHQYALSAIAADFKMPINIFYTDNYTFENVSLPTFQQLSGHSNNMYSIDGSYIWIDTSFGTGTLQLDYYSHYAAKTSGGSIIAQLSTSTDEPLLPLRFQPMIIDYADAMCQRKEGLLNDYQIAQAKFLGRLEKMKREYPSVRTTAIIRMKQGDFGKYRTSQFGKSNPLNQ